MNGGEISDQIEGGDETYDEIRPVELADGVLRLIDQRQLPGRLEYVECKNAPEVVTAIKSMVVRGAPAIGIAGAMGVAAHAASARAATPTTLMKQIESAARRIRDARPTAINLAWAVDRVAEAARAAAADGATADEIRDVATIESEEIAYEEESACEAIGAFGDELLPSSGNVLTHCNTGALATGAYGSALGLIRGATESGCALHVWIDETRPALQGARLTAWELGELKIPSTLIVDSAAGWLMARGEVDAVVVGADRIAANGDVANKIGTYSLAVLAKANRIPFYVAAPLSTLDLNLRDGGAIPLEDRDRSEVASISGQEIVPHGVAILNPAFDVTPARLITAIVTESGIAHPPYKSLAKMAAG